MLILSNLSLLQFVHSIFLLLDWIFCKRIPSNSSPMVGSISIATICEIWSSEGSIFPLALCLVFITVYCSSVSPRPSFGWIQSTEVQLGKWSIFLTLTLVNLSSFLTSSNPWLDSLSWYVILLLITSFITCIFWKTVKHYNTYLLKHCQTQLLYPIKVGFPEILW